jgi:hypothetical protein
MRIWEDVQIAKLGTWNCAGDQNESMLRLLFWLGQLVPLGIKTK